MTDFQHILVPFDGSDSSKIALHTAHKLNRDKGGKLTAVYVKKTESDSKADEVENLITNYEEKFARKILFIRPTGKMYKEVVKTIDEVGADLVVMGTHGTSGFEEFWIGSNAYRVVSSSQVPVITMQETFNKEGFKKILVPIDQSKATRQKIPMVAMLAKSFNSDIHLLGTSKYNDEESQANVKRYLEQSLELLEKEELTATVSYEFGRNIAKTTMEHAEDLGADLIIMMSESEPSVGLFMGSNAQQVVNQSKIPVMTLEPKDVGIAITGY